MSRFGVQIELILVRKRRCVVVREKQRIDSDAETSGHSRYRSRLRRQRIAISDGYEHRRIVVRQIVCDEKLPEAWVFVDLAVAEICPHGCVDKSTHNAAKKPQARRIIEAAVQDDTADLATLN